LAHEMHSTARFGSSDVTFSRREKEAQPI